MMGKYFNPHGRKLMNKINNKGPKTEPWWGIPLCVPIYQYTHVATFYLTVC